MLNQEMVMKFESLFRSIGSLPGHGSVTNSSSGSEDWPFFQVIRGAANISRAEAVSSHSFKSVTAYATFVIRELLEIIRLANPACAAAHVLGDSSAANTAEIAPPAVTNEALTHFWFDFWKFYLIKIMGNNYRMVIWILLDINNYFLLLHSILSKRIDSIYKFL